MALPAPRLDDRRFQDLVDDAKRYVMRRCPEWTDHNVSDPGVTLIETFAFMTDQLLYRLNRVPERLYVKFLDLIGLHMLPPTPARAPVTFWLSTPAMNPVVIVGGTKAASLRTETQDSVVFATMEELTIVPCALHVLMTRAGSGDEDSGDEAVAGRVQPEDHTAQLRLRVAFPAFSPTPTVGDVLLVGLTEPVPRCAVRLDFTCHIDGVGVDPTDPPLIWEAWTADGWVACDLATDETGGLNRDGGVVVMVPHNHEASIIDAQRAGWLRARVLKSEDGQPSYSSSPIIHGLAASTVGGTVDAIHAEIIENEFLGLAEGVPGQRLSVSRTPILAGAAAPILEIGSEDGWLEWTQVEHFAESRPDSTHFVLDHVMGEVQLGPAIREKDGSLRQYGAVPPKDALIRLSRYATGGGMAGNLSKGSIQTLKSSIPFVAGVENLKPAHGGVNGETIEQAKERGPILLRTRGRAVTSEDYEEITREAAPEVARVKCLTAGEGGVDAGSVKVLVVPACPAVDGRIEFADLVPDESTLKTIAERLDDVRLIGARVLVEPPLYRGLTIVARLVARPRVSVDRVREDALTALYSFVSPITGGPDGQGWPFGRPVQTGDIFGLLQQIRGVEMVEDVRLFAANPVTGQRGAETRRLDIEPTNLVFSFEHQVKVEQH